MVTASKLEAVSVGAGFSAVSTVPPQEDIDSQSVEGENGFPSIRVSSLCFGEQLVLDTYLRSRSRPYNRERQEELSRPRNRGGISACWNKAKVQHRKGGELSFGQVQPQKPPRSTESDYYSSDEGPSNEEDQGSLPLLCNRGTPRAHTNVKKVVERLSKPRMIKRDKVGPGEEKVLLHLKGLREKALSTDIRELTGRLSNPKPKRTLSPTPGERIVLEYKSNIQGRRCNLKRIDQLAVAPPRRTREGFTRPCRRGHDDRADSELDLPDDQVPVDFVYMSEQDDAHHRGERAAAEDVTNNCRGASQGSSYTGGGASTALESDHGQSSVMMPSPPSTANTNSRFSTPARTGTSGTCGGGGIPNLPEVPSSTVSGTDHSVATHLPDFTTTSAQVTTGSSNSTPRARPPETWRVGVDGQA